MLGYVSVSKDQLNQEELEIYRGYYCGVCKSMSRYGQFPRFALTYDSVFLALILASLDDKKEEIANEHCIVHHIKKNPVVRESKAIDYAADILLLLAYYNFLDDKRDEHRLRGSIGASFLKTAFEALSVKYPEITSEIEWGIEDLFELEQNKSASLDETSSAFGAILGSVFSGYYEDETVNRVLAELGYNLGRWIYVMDALDDFDDDKKKRSYNPLLYRECGKDGLEDTLYNYLGRVASSVDLLAIKKNKGIIDNIVLLGLRGRTESLLNKGKEGTSEAADKEKRIEE